MTRKTAEQYFEAGRIVQEAVDQIVFLIEDEDYRLKDEAIKAVNAVSDLLGSIAERGGLEVLRDRREAKA